MMTQPAQLVARLLLHIFHECLVEGGIARTGKFEIQPDADAEFVAGVEQRVVLVITAAPETEHVHVHRHGIGDVTAEPFGRDAIRENVGGNPVRTFGEKRNAIDFEAQGIFPVWRQQFQRAQTNPPHGAVQYVAIATVQLDVHFVKRLVAHAGRPPEFRVVDFDGNACQAIGECGARSLQSFVAALRAIIDFQKRERRYGGLGLG